MVIWPAFRIGQYRVNDHPYHAPQFSILLMKFFSEARHLKSVEALLDDEDINKTKEISKDAARTE